jgi:membrane protease YdiL (CAAX protease family)
MRRAFLGSSIVLYGGGFLVTLLLVRWFGAPALRYTPGPWDEISTWTGTGREAAIGTMAGVAVVVAGLVGRRFAAALRAMEQEFAAFFSWNPSWGDLFLLAATSSLAEEAFFRGLLQPWLGLHLASLLFAACHPPLSRRLLLWTPFALAMGYLLGWLFEVSGGLLIAPTLAHFTVNLLNLRIITGRTGARPDGIPFAEPTRLSPSPGTETDPPDPDRSRELDHNDL